jgi:hypothetical protein
MRIPWKAVGLAGVAGVAAAGGAVAVRRRRRAQAELDPEELRARLHRRLEEAGRGADGPPAEVPPPGPD